MENVKNKEYAKVDEDKKEYFLPIGSIVLLKNADKKLMVTGYAQESKEKGYFDYCGCLFPEGMIDYKIVTVFNNDQIEQVFFKGFVNSEQIEFMDTLMNEVDKYKNSKKESNINIE